LQGKGLVRQRSISADSRYSQLFIFIGAHYLATLGLVTFEATKVTRPSSGHERVYAMQSTDYPKDIACSFLLNAAIPLFIYTAPGIFNNRSFVPQDDKRISLNMYIYQLSSAFYIQNTFFCLNLH